MVFVSSSLSPDTRVCGRNSGQCMAVPYIINFGNIYENGPPEARKLLFGEYTKKVVSVKLPKLCNPVVL
jgi:hypothetical protein